MLNLTFALPVTHISTAVAQAPGRAGVVRLDITCAARSISMARAFGFAMAARMEERLLVAGGAE